MAGHLLRAPGLEGLPEGCLYLHAAHLRLERPASFDWLYARPDVRAVFTVHDLIPLDYPEYCRPGEAARHAVRLATVARHARHVLVDSEAVRAALLAHLRGRGLPVPPVTPIPLGIEPAFSPAFPDAPAPPSDAGPRRATFLVCGTIEPRKNHLLLLNVWRRLAEEAAAGGPLPPRLVVVGRRGWEAEGALAMLDRCPGLAGHVEEVPDLTTPGLAQAMREATALLMPSFAEGYGLPVLEAAACGLPVVASDIAVHRETAGAFARFLAPDDGLGWLEAVRALSAPGSGMRADLARRTAQAAVPRWAGYFAQVEEVLGATG